MRLIILLAIMTAVHTSVAQEWQSLFNGKDLKGWGHVGEGSFEIEDGLLKTVGGMGLLWYTEQKFEDSCFWLV